MLCSPDILTFDRIVTKPIYMAPEHLLEVSEGPRSAPEVSGMSRNGPGMSRKVLEASRRSWKVPEGSGCLNYALEAIINCIIIILGSLLTFICMCYNCNGL